VSGQRFLRRLWGESIGPIDVRGIGSHEDTKMLANSVMLKQVQGDGFFLTPQGLKQVALILKINRNAL
jgi:hypothetical protein